MRRTLSHDLCSRRSGLFSYSTLSSTGCRVYIFVCQILDRFFVKLFINYRISLDYHSTWHLLQSNTEVHWSFLPVADLSAEFYRCVWNSEVVSTKTKLRVFLRQRWWKTPSVCTRCRSTSRASPGKLRRCERCFNNAILRLSLAYGTGGFPFCIEGMQLTKIFNCSSANNKNWA